MIVLGMMAFGAGLLRALARPLERLVSAKELTEPGMVWRRVGWRKVPIDGVWTAPELRCEARATGSRVNIGSLGVKCLARRRMPTTIRL